MILLFYKYFTHYLWFVSEILYDFIRRKLYEQTNESLLITTHAFFVNNINDIKVSVVTMCKNVLFFCVNMFHRIKCVKQKR